MVSFACSADDARLIGKIVNRGLSVADAAGIRLNAMDTDMDITAAHCNGCPMDLGEMLNADAFDFAHDFFGILRHIDRETGRLRDCFVPRCAKQE